MHSSLILLTLISLLLVFLLLACFAYFVRLKRREDEELMRREQLANAHQLLVANPQSTPAKLCLSNQQSAHNNHLQQQQHQQHQQHQQQQQMHDQQANISPFHASQLHHQQQQQQQLQHQQQLQQQQNQQQQQQLRQRANETHADITQQINSAVIGSSEAEFQNDFIQVFPMYQIAPQPEKNTTPYLI